MLQIIFLLLSLCANTFQLSTNTSSLLPLYNRLPIFINQVGKNKFFRLDFKETFTVHVPPIFLLLLLLLLLRDIP